jgi:hypothetical protein
VLSVIANIFDERFRSSSLSIAFPHTVVSLVSFLPVTNLT